jgi:cytochrome P450
MFASRRLISASQGRAFSALPYSQIPRPTTLPVLGSLGAKEIRFDLETGEPIDVQEMSRWREQLMKAFGPIYRLKFPGQNECVVIDCPNEMMKVMEHQCPHPHGAVEMLWPQRHSFASQDSAATHMFANGEQWKHARLGLQHGLVAPKDARKYIPGITKAAELSLESFPQNEPRQILSLLERTAFDMLMSAICGRLTKSATLHPNENDLKFCQEVSKYLGLTSQFITDGKENLLHSLGIDSRKMKVFKKHLNNIHDYGNALTADFVQRHAEGKLNEYEESSYFAKALGDVAAKHNHSTKEMRDFAILLLVAGIDTTSNSLHWILIALAQNPELQEKLYEETKNVAISSETRFAQALPYTQQVLRETHRLFKTIGSGSLEKSSPVDLVLHGYEVPKGTYVSLAMTKDSDPNLVEKPELFNPEMWSPEAVRARKGTDAEIIDHRLLADPFSAGARMCPGSRVANLEIQILLHSLVQRYRFRLDPKDQTWKTKIFLTNTPDPIPTFLFEKR